MEKIVDTNVPIVAAKKVDNKGDDCIDACIFLIESIRDGSCRLVLDSNSVILKQYKANLNGSGDMGLARRFLLWVFRNHYIEERVKLVDVTPIGDHGDFKELPDEVRQSDFDRSDRVFVALSIANGNQAPIVQAADSKWIGWEEMLARHGVRLEFPCRQALEVVHKRKDKRRK